MQTYCAKNGERIEVNVTGNSFLTKLTFGLWDKAGIPRPLSKKDALLVARLLRNYATLQRITQTASALYQKGFWGIVGYQQDDENEVIWVEKMAEFFINSGGLFDEEK